MKRTVVRKNQSVMNQPCSECGGPLRRKSITQSFEREGIKVTLKGMRGHVCTKCGEIYFEPGASQAVVEAANKLFELARKTNHRKGTLVGAVN